MKNTKNFCVCVYLLSSILTNHISVSSVQLNLYGTVFSVLSAVLVSATPSADTAVQDSSPYINGNISLLFTPNKILYADGYFYIAGYINDNSTKGYFKHLERYSETGIAPIYSYSGNSSGVYTDVQVTSSGLIIAYESSTSGEDIVDIFSIDPSKLLNSVNLLWTSSSITKQEILAVYDDYLYVSGPSNIYVADTSGVVTGLPVYYPQNFVVSAVLVDSTYLFVSGAFITSSGYNNIFEPTLIMYQLEEYEIGQGAQVWNHTSGNSSYDNSNQYPNLLISFPSFNAVVYAANIGNSLWILQIFDVISGVQKFAWNNSTYYEIQSINILNTDLFVLYASADDSILLLDHYIFEVDNLELILQKRSTETISDQFYGFADMAISTNTLQGWITTADQIIIVDLNSNLTTEVTYSTVSTVCSSRSSMSSSSSVTLFERNQETTFSFNFETSYAAVVSTELIAATTTTTGLSSSQILNTHVSQKSLGYTSQRYQNQSNSMFLPENSFIASSSLNQLESGLISSTLAEQEIVVSDSITNSAIGNTNLSHSFLPSNNIFQNIPILVGIILGIVLLMLLVVILVIIRRKRMRKRRGFELSKSKILDLTDSTNVSVSGMTSMNNTQLTATSTNNTTMVNTTMALGLPGYKQIMLENDVKVEKEVASGGFGSVSIGTLLNPNLVRRYGIKKVAIKKYMTDNDMQANYVLQKSFEQEVAVLEHFQRHPNIVKMIGFNMKPNVMVMKYYEYGNLGDWLFATDDSTAMIRYTVDLAHTLIKDVGLGLQALHMEGVTHCDIKPANILMDDTGGKVTAVLCDLGLSNVLNERLKGVKSFKLANLNGASLYFAAPEVITGNVNDLYATDIYSYSLVMFSCVTRKIPWWAIPSETIQSAIVSGQRPVIPSDIDKNPKTKKLLELMKQCWNQDASKRPNIEKVLSFLSSIF